MCIVADKLPETETDILARVVASKPASSLPLVANQGSAADPASKSVNFVYQAYS